MVDETAESEYLIGLTKSELEALAESKLAPNQQARLSQLLEKQKENGLQNKEFQELDRLLDHIDQLTILKTRALLTLRNQ